MPTISKQSEGNAVKDIASCQRFQEQCFTEERALFEQSVCGRSSLKALIVACADSRVDLALLTGAEPGDMVIVRNVANLVPSYASGSSFASARAVLELAVLSLKVEHIIILGHARCGGIHVLIGWYFDLEVGALLHYNPARNTVEEARSNQQPTFGVSA